MKPLWTPTAAPAPPDGACAPSTALGQARQSVQALAQGQWQHAHQGLVATARQLAARARWLEADLQRRHQVLSDRFMLQAQRLQPSAPELAAAALAAVPSRVLHPWALHTAHPLAPPDVPIDAPNHAANDAPDDGPRHLDQVVGADAIKRLFRARFIHPLQDPARAALYKQRGAGGVLLYGPPGTGKTFIVRALARELAIPVYAVSPAEMLSKWLGESEKHLASLFAQARQHPAALIFVDEIDALAPSRDSSGDNGGPMQRLLTQLLTELDGFARPTGCLLFVGATNRPWALDSALLRPGRLDAVAYLGLPSAATRAQLLRHHLQGVPQPAGLDWAQAAAALQGCSAAETVACASQAARLAFEDAVRTGRNRPVSMADLLAAAQTTHPAATPELLARYAAFAKARGLPAPEDDGDGDGDGGSNGGGNKPAAGGAGSPNAPDAATPCANTIATALLPPVTRLGFEPFRFVKARDLDIQVEALPFMCYALQHAGIAPIRQLTVVNNGVGESQNLLVEVALAPAEYGEPWRANIARLAPGGQWQSGPISLPLRLERLRVVAEKERAHLRISVRDKDEVLLARTEELPVLAYNEWVYLPKFLALAAAYVQPNSPALHPVVQAAASRLQAATGSTAFAGYQTGGRDQVGHMLQALHDTLAQDQALAYINPPPSFEVSGQKICLVADTLARGRGTCLDLAILQAALWEHVGLHPLLVLVPGHAFVACWADERQALGPVVVLRPGEGGRAAKDIEQALNDGALRVFNSVEITQGQSLLDAEQKGLAILRQTLHQGAQVQFIDIGACRGQVTPLP